MFGPKIGLGKSLEVDLWILCYIVAKTGADQLGVTARVKCALVFKNMYLQKQVFS